MKRATLLAITLSCLFVAWNGCGGPPQIGADRDTFKAVDALYTAVSLRDAKLVGQCEGNLKGLQDASKIPQAAFASLQSIIAEANGGKWEDAQERLTNFMEGQSR